MNPTFLAFFVSSSAPRTPQPCDTKTKRRKRTTTHPPFFAPGCPVSQHCPGVRVYPHSAKSWIFDFRPSARQSPFYAWELGETSESGLVKLTVAGVFRYRETLAGKWLQEARLGAAWETRRLISVSSPVGWAQW